MNEGDVTTRFLQIWLTPDKRGVKPQYGSKTFQPEDRRNRYTLQENLSLTPLRSPKLAISPAPSCPHVIVLLPVSDPAADLAESMRGCAAEPAALMANGCA